MLSPLLFSAVMDDAIKYKGNKEKDEINENGYWKIEDVKVEENKDESL